MQVNGRITVYELHNPRIPPTWGYFLPMPGVLRQMIGVISIGARKVLS